MISNIQLLRTGVQSYGPGNAESDTTVATSIPESGHAGTTTRREALARFLRRRSGSFLAVKQAHGLQLYDTVALESQKESRASLQTPLHTVAGVAEGSGVRLQDSTTMLSVLETQELTQPLKLQAFNAS